MMLRAQIALDPEIQRKARLRASNLGVSLAEYVRRLVVRDLGGSPATANPEVISISEHPEAPTLQETKTQ
jgi:hypothetical protein